MQRCWKQSGKAVFTASQFAQCLALNETPGLSEVQIISYLNNSQHQHGSHKGWSGKNKIKQISKQWALPSFRICHFTSGLAATQLLFMHLKSTSTFLKISCKHFVFWLILSYFHKQTLKQIFKEKRQRYFIKHIINN